MGLGGYSLVSLAEARQRATDARKLRERGIDPIAQRDAQRASQAVATLKVTTFDQAVAGYCADRERTWTTDHAHDWQASVANHASPVFGSLPVGLVDTPLVLKALRPLWHTKTVTARRLRERIEAVLDWAIASQLRDGPNPARWRGHLEKILGVPDHIVEHHPAMAYQEIGTLVAELEQRTDRDARCLLLLILTATRLSAATGARAEEFDLANRIWTIPAPRMKRKGKRKKLGFRVPLSDAAVRLIERIGVKTGPLFPRADHKSLAAAHGRPEITVHGFRSTFRDWAGEQATHIAREVAEMAMSHVVVGETEESYFRSDLLERRRPLMEQWARHCATLPSDRGAVIPMHRGIPA
jgi:integrase